MLGDGNDDYLDRGYFRRQHEAVVIPMRHYYTADYAGRKPPGSLERIFLFVIFVCKGDVKLFCESITEEM